MPKGIYKRKKRGRPKGSRNKVDEAKIQRVWNAYQNNIIKATSPTEPASFISRLEAATIKYEQAVNEAIEALKGK